MVYSIWVLCSNDISYLTYLYSLTEENKILHVNFQHIEMSYKLWVHSPQGIYYIVSPKLYNNSCHQYKVSQDIITHESILYANNLNCIQCTQWTNYHFQSIAMSNRHSTGILGVFLYTHPILMYWQASKTKTGGNLFICYHPSLALTILRGIAATSSLHHITTALLHHS